MRFPGSSARQVAAATNVDGSMHLFYVGMDGNLYTNSQVTAAGGWAGDSATGYAASAVGVIADFVPTVSVFFLGISPPPASGPTGPGAARNRQPRLIGPGRAPKVPTQPPIQAPSRRRKPAPMTPIPAPTCQEPRAPRPLMENRSTEWPAGVRSRPNPHHEDPGEATAR